MIEYFKNLLSKPQYQWTVLEGAAFAGLIIGIVLIITGIAIAIVLIKERIRLNKQIKDMIKKENEDKNNLVHKASKNDTNKGE